MAPLLIKNRWFGIAIPISAMVVSDVIIGFNFFQLLIYFTIFTIALVSPMQKKNYTILGFMALGASLWFFILTNFAVWSFYNYYPKTIEGLFTCYTLALPFFKNTLISTCLFTGLIVFLLKYLEIIKEKTNNLIFNLIYKN
jgi:hypothetical protein